MYLFGYLYLAKSSISPKYTPVSYPKNEVSSSINFIFTRNGSKTVPSIFCIYALTGIGLLYVSLIFPYISQTDFTPAFFISSSVGFSRRS